MEKSEEKIKWKEGCLSYPNVFAVIERYKKIKIKYLNKEGKEIVSDFKEQEAVICQHESEHLQDGFCKIYDFWKEK